MRAVVGAIGWRQSDFDPASACSTLTGDSENAGRTPAWHRVHLGRGSLACVADETWRRSPVAIASRGRVLVAADARLVEREDLRAALSACPPEGSDADLILEAYGRWGADFPAHLLGDFSAVVYDDNENRVILATGGSGARQLYYWHDSKGALVSTLPAPIQSARRMRHSDVDSTTIREYLAGRYRDPRRTFFTEMRRVPPGFRVILSSGAAESRRYWLPPSRALELGLDEEYLEAFAALFRRCVSDAVERDAPHVAHLSGGLDSSSIVMTLPLIERGRATFELMTAVYPTLRSCNETAAVHAVLKRVPFAARSWNAEAIWDLQREGDLSPWPLGVVPTAIGTYEDLDYAARIGAAAVLSGDGGDALCVESAVFRDLARQGRWRMLWDELSAPGLRADLRKLLVRQSLHEIAARVRGASSDPDPDEKMNHPDLVQRQVWSAMTDPTDMWTVETMNLRAWQAGVELRCPYRDTRLTTFVASIPYHHRVCRGKLRRLQRVGLAKVIPATVRSRMKTNLTNAVRFLVRAELSAAEAPLREGSWCAEPYVSEASFGDLKLDLSSGMGDGAASIQKWYLARRIVTLELWLRRLAR